MDNNTPTSDEDPPPKPRDGWLLVRIHVPELNVYKCLQFPADRLVWDVKQQVLASLPKELKESFNYGLFCPPSNGKAGKFLDEERRLGDYPFNGPVGYLELKYKRRVYKLLNLDERQLKALHTRANLRRFLECINGGHVEKIAKMCSKGLDPNFHCHETGETPLTVATGAKKPNKLLITLVNGGALLDYRTKDGATALHKAVEKDSLEAVTTLLELGASPNYKDIRGITPLYISITRKCDPKITENLLHDHATLGIQDNQGWQEVHQACRHGLVHHLEHLLFYGADMDGRNASGNTPLHVCAVNNQEACARMLLFRGAQRGALNYANQTPYQVAVIAGNLELAEVIQNYKTEDVVPFRCTPRYNPRRRSGVGWLTGNGCGGSTANGSLISTLTRNSSCPGQNAPPSPCPSEHLPYSSASSSLSEGSSGHRSHEDDISIVTDKSLGDTSDIISDSSGVGTNSDSAACSIGHPSTTVVCMEPYSGNSVGHIYIQPGDVIEVVGSTDCGLLEGYVRGSNQSGFFPAEYVQEVNIRQKHILNVSTSSHQHQHQQQRQLLYRHPESHANVLEGPSANGSNSFTLPRNIMMMSHQQPLSIGRNTYNKSMDGEPYSSATAPRIKKSSIAEPRTVYLHRAKRGFGFILRGAKASSPLMHLKPSDRFPALQYLDDVDPGGVADMAGLKPGDFLLAIGSEDVRAASHEKVVDIIRSAGTLVSMTVISPQYPNQMQSTPQYLQNNHVHQGPSTPQSVRQCATLPRKMSLGPTTASAAGGTGCNSASSSISGSSTGGRFPAPLPPRRDPKTTLSVGRARAKSMVAGLENGGEKEGVPTKSNSVESISTPTPTHPGTPVQFRTASIKARPTSSRITAAELEELFQRQQGEAAGSTSRYSTMMTSSCFQSGTDSGAATPPANCNSPLRGPLVYGSVAEMKRKTKTKNFTLRARPCSIPTIGSRDLKRFHSTPDLNSDMKSSSSSIWNGPGKGHHSQDDVATLHASMHRLELPPPSHPPPPPPIGQVVKVDVSRCSEYESTLTLQHKLKKPTESVSTTTTADGVASSFNPSANAKLYASPQELRNVIAWKTRTFQENRQTNCNQQPQNIQHQTQSQSHAPQLQQTEGGAMTVPPLLAQPLQSQSKINQYAQLTRQPISGEHEQYQLQHIHSKTESVKQKQHSQQDGDNGTVNLEPFSSGSAPPIPEPDYSLSESDSEDENSILVARNTKLNEKISLVDVPETSGNSHASGSSSGSASISHSFSVDELQRVRTGLKQSKSYPNGFTKPDGINAKEKSDKEDDNKNNSGNSSEQIPENNTMQTPSLKKDGDGDDNEECGDDSSSGVSSDQDIVNCQPSSLATNESGVQPVKQLRIECLKSKLPAEKEVTNIVQKPLQQPQHKQLSPEEQKQEKQTPQEQQGEAIFGQGIVVSTPSIITSSQNTASKVKAILKSSQPLGPQMPPVVAGRIAQHHLHRPLQKVKSEKNHEHSPSPLACQYQSTNHTNQLSCCSKNVSIASTTFDSEPEQRSDDERDLSPSPPAKAFQRHNSLTRKQAAAIAMNRASRAAVSLVQLPPPMEADSDNEILNSASCGKNSSDRIGAVCPENIVLAPPPQFCDCNDIKHPTSSSIAGINSLSNPVSNSVISNRVRIVGAVPKANRLHSQ